MSERDVARRSAEAELWGDGVRTGTIREDPVTGVQMVKLVGGGYRPATLAEVEALIAREVAAERRIGKSRKENERT